MPPITTLRLDLEPITRVHAEELFELLADPTLHHFVPFEPPTLDQQRERCARWENGRSPDGKEIWLNWAGRQRSSGRVVGHFQAAVKEDHTSTVGYVVAREYQGQGYATEAMSAVFCALRDVFQAWQVKAWSDTRNVASHALAKKLSMVLVETLPNADFFKGASSDEYVFAKDL